MATISSDYAHLQGGDTEAYYGYEFAPRDSDGDEQWGFYVKVGGKVVYSATLWAMTKRNPRLNKFECAECLLIGMEMYLTDTQPKEQIREHT